MGKTLDMYGNMYVVLPADSDFDVTPLVNGDDYYNWSESESKHTLTITASSTTTNSDICTNTPEFCVGQNITFTPEWLDDGDPGETNATYGWTFSGQYVNDYSQDSSYASDNYFINFDLLNVASPHAWWYSSGPKNAYLYETLHFSGGEVMTLKINGAFTMYRPIARIIQWYQYGTPLVVLLTPGAWGPIGVGEGVNGSNSMDFTAGVTSHFHGLNSWIQIVNINCTGTIYLDGIQNLDLEANDVLDNQNPFNGTWEVFPNMATNTIPLDDSPAAVSDNVNEYITLQIRATDYLMFEPDGGIPVCLGKTTEPWSANATVTSPSTTILPSSAVPGPGQLDGSIDFPQWTDTISNP
jgi:hypothetical protein